MIINPAPLRTDGVLAKIQISQIRFNQSELARRGTATRRMKPTLICLTSSDIYI